MKMSFLRSSFSLLLLAATASAELNLSPKLITLDYAGTAVRRAYFMDGQTKYAVTMDNETELTSRGDGALFTFTKLALATVELHRSPVKSGTPFTEESIVEYAKAARQMLAETAQIWPEQPMEMDPLPINRWKTCRFNFVYRVGGSPVRANVTFIQLNEKDQIVVVTGGSANNYAEVLSRSDDIIRRWHKVSEIEEKGIN